MCVGDSEIEVVVQGTVRTLAILWLKCKLHESRPTPEDQIFMIILHGFLCFCVLYGRITVHLAKVQQSEMESSFLHAVITGSMDMSEFVQQGSYACGLRCVWFSLPDMGSAG